jgi:hypothetical protein
VENFEVERDTNGLRVLRSTERFFEHLKEEFEQ